MTGKNEVKPLAIFVEAYIWLHTRTSVRVLLFGADPTKTPNYILSNQGRWINRDTLVDLYAIIRVIIDCLLLWLVASPLQTHPMTALLVGLFTLHRLNELLGGVLYILIHRARFDYADGRKMAITLLAYLEPVLLFAILHGALSIILAGTSFSISGTGYALAGKPLTWSWITLLHYSVGCYTTVGWGDVSATLPFTMALSDIETMTGVVMLTLTISRFVAAALDPGMAGESGQPKNQDATTTHSGQ